MEYVKIMFLVLSNNILIDSFSYRCIFNQLYITYVYYTYITYKRIDK